MPPYRLRRLLGFLLLTALALGGNYLAVPLFYGVDFLFGGIAIFIIVSCFGVWAGSLAAAISSLPTIPLWNHPYAMLIATAEALVVGILLHRRKLHLVSADLLFWLIAGIPLVWLAFFGIMDTSPSSTLLISFKLSTNGLFNALLAGLLFNYLPIPRWLGAEDGYSPPALYDVLFHLLLAFALLATFALMVLNGRISIQNLEKGLAGELHAVANDISYHLSSRLEFHQHAVKTLADFAAGLDLVPSRRLQRITALIARSFPDFHNMYVADAKGITAAFYPPRNAAGESTIGLDFSDRPYFQEMKTSLQPVISDVFPGRGGTGEPIVTLSQPIVKEGRFGGYALGALDLKGVVQLLRSYSENKAMEIIILDGQRNVLAATGNALSLMSRYIPEPGREKVLQGNIVLVQPEERRQPAVKQWRNAFLLYQAPIIPSLPWTLVIRKPMAHTQEALTSIYLRHLAIMLVLAVLAILLARQISNVFTRSVAQLVTTTNDLPDRLVSGGKIESLAWPEAKTRELQILINNFRSTAAIVQQSFQELQARTGELRRVNEELQQEISERQRLEETVQRQKKMEAIGNLAATVAHDLNNILSGLVGYPDLLLHELAPENPLRTKILRIKESGERAAAVVQDLLTLARRGVVQKNILNLNEIAASVLDSPSFRSLQETHPGITIKTSLASELLNISGSEAHIAKSLMNLIVNAAEAMPAGGELLIYTENRSLDRPLEIFERIEPGDYAILGVRDSGVGIPPQDQRKIFEPFYTRKVMGRSGTGLGMSVVWNTVKDLGGHLDLQSQEGRGTTIELYFPVDRGQAAAMKPMTPLEEYLGTERILVVDDLEDQREIAAGMLRKLGYTVFTAASGEEALRLVQTEPVDLVVLDMIMEPGPDGLETYRRFIRLRPGQRAIIASGFAETDRVREAQQLGAGAYIAKPYTMEKLGVAVRRELDRKRE